MMRSNVYSSNSVIRCSALVARQRALLARLRKRGDERTVASAERLLHSFERSLIALLVAHRHRRKAAARRDDRITAEAAPAS